jgi:hypothetical protein
MSHFYCYRLNKEKCQNWGDAADCTEGITTLAGVK